MSVWLLGTFSNTSLLAEVTVTDSVAAPTDSGIVKAIGTDVRTFKVCFAAIKPAAVTVREYVFGGTPINLNVPSLSVLTVRLNPVTAFSIVTAAFGTTALLGSVTVPVTVPAVSDWAKAEKLKTKTRVMRAKD